MTVGVAQFTFEMDKELGEIETKKLLPLKQKIALQAMDGVILMMPVDTGRARGNTLVSVGSPDFTSSDATDKNGDSTMAKGSSKITADRDPYAPVYVQNNLPYIEALEGGHSDQSYGMFAITFARIQAQFR